MQEIQSFNQELIEFVNASPTPFHAVANMLSALEEVGFERLDERTQWHLKAGGRYVVTRNDSAIIAFVVPPAGMAETQGLRMVGAHTDSPCLKVKPQPEVLKQGYFQLGVEVYGGVLLNPWFDRDLSLAGRVNYVDKDGHLAVTLVDYQRPIAVIPSLAIHLDREANSSRSINAQKDLPPVLMQAEEKADFRDLLVQQLQRQQVEAEKVLDYELMFYDTQPGTTIGLHEEFIASARLDNLLSCFVGLQSLLHCDQSRGALLVCNDHEEVGSVSAAGADGPFLHTVLERMLPDAEVRSRALAHSFMVSADNAHGVHPNFEDRHDGNHGPKLNQGPVIKINANQRYATNSETSAMFRHLAEQEQVKVQSFTVRSDMACGSTIGPITAGRIGIATLDVGVPTFGMHSIRELAGRDDAYGLYRILRRLQS